MKFTCLSKGTDYHFPPCHILHVCGFCILVDCPLDLSGLAIFSPIPNDASSVLDERASDISNGFESTNPKRNVFESAKKLVMTEPWYKTVTSLNLWDISFIDFILISSPMGMLGLPFLTRARDFSAKIYATEVASRIGQLMIEDLVSMHKEFKHFYGPQDTCFPQWMKWEELEFLPSVLKEITLGKDGKDLGAWMPLYSAADAKDCMQKIETLKYAEEACYNGTLIITAFSSGLEIGTCNWMIKAPKGNFACLSSSVFDSAVAMNFNYSALQRNDMTIFSDFSFMSNSDDSEDKISDVNDDIDSMEALNNVFLDTDDNSEEMEKLTYICSGAIESVKAGGSVIIPIGRIGIILQLLEFLSFSLETSNLEVPMFFVSTIAEELLAFTNIIPEWLCKQRQNKLFSCEPLFATVQLLKEKKLHLFPSIYSHELLALWQEPCIVFCPHWSLRLGPVVPLLHRWCRDPNSLLVMEEGVNVDLALLPFKPMLMNVCRCSFRSGIKLHKIKYLLKILQPKYVLIPNELTQRLSTLHTASFSVIQYREGETLEFPGPNEPYKIQIAKEAHLAWKKHKISKLTRLKGSSDLLMDDGEYRLSGHGNEEAECSQGEPVVRWGSIDVKKLLSAFQKMGIKGEPDAELDDCKVVRVHEPNAALIEIRGSSTVISCHDEGLASRIFYAIDDMLYGI